MSAGALREVAGSVAVQPSKGPSDVHQLMQSHPPLSIPPPSTFTPRSLDFLRAALATELGECITPSPLTPHTHNGSGGAARASGRLAKEVEPGLHSVTVHSTLTTRFRGNSFSDLTRCP